MIKAIAIPQDNKLTLTIPSDYISKKLEILVYSTDEVIKERNATMTMSDFWGTISDETAHDLHIQTSEGRNGWEENSFLSKEARV